jgi:hypothetical protein
MKMFRHKMMIAISAMGLLIASIMSAQAATVSWTDWTSKTASTVSGTLNVDSKPIDVTYTGGHYFAQTNDGTNYWNPSAPYLSSAVDNAPLTSDIIALDAGGTGTISFSEMVRDPLMALVSWNGNTVDFGVPIEILSYGKGYFGQGTPILNDAGTGFYGDGEVHGVIRIPGDYDSITFTHTSEYWHGFTIGATGLPTPVPAPAAAWLLGAALVGVVGLRRVRKN